MGYEFEITNQQTKKTGFLLIGFTMHLLGFPGKIDTYIVIGQMFFLLLLLFD